MTKQYLIIGVLCFIISIGITVQVKTVQSWNTSTSMQSTTENKLKDSVLKEKEKYERTYQELQDVTTELENIRSTVADSSTEASKIEKQISELNAILGYTDVKGKGLVVTVKDGTPENTEGFDTDYLSMYMVHDGDLKNIVNELFNAGAEAVSINGERIVSVSSIMCSGNIIRVNGEKLGSRYEIKAIGNPNELYGQLLRPGGYLEWMEYEGVSVEVREESNITVPKYTGVYNSDYLKRAD